MRHMNDSFAVVHKMILGNYHRIGNDVINVGSTHCARIAYITDLNRSRAQGKYPGAGILGETFEVDSNIDLHAPCQCSADCVVMLRNINELIKSLDQPRPHIVLLIWAKREGKNLKSGTIMPLEQFRHEVGGGVNMEISREVPNTDSFMVIRLSSPKRLFRRRLLQGAR